MNAVKYLKKIVHKNQKIIKFLVSGGSAALVEYATFALLIYLFLDYLLVVNAISFMFGLLVSFSLNKHWVFKNKNDTKRQFVRYIILACINLAVGGLMLYILVSMLGLGVLIAKLIMMTLIAIWNYAIFSKIIFKNT